MGYRKFLDAKPRQSAAIAVGLLLVAALFIAMRLRGPGPENVFFYDLDSGRLVIVTTESLSPNTTLSSSYAYSDGDGGSWVRANIFACGDPAASGVAEGMDMDAIAATGAKLLWLDRYSVEGVALLQRLISGETLSKEDSNRVGALPVLIADPLKLDWTPQKSGAGVEIMSGLQSLCSGGEPAFVTP